MKPRGEYGNLYGEWRFDEKNKPGIMDRLASVWETTKWFCGKVMDVFTIIFMVFCGCAVALIIVGGAIAISYAPEWAAQEAAMKQQCRDKGGLPVKIGVELTCLPPGSFIPLVKL